MNRRTEAVKARDYVIAEAKAQNKPVYYIDRQGRRIREEVDGTKYVYLYRDKDGGGYFLLEELQEQLW